ncbi:hypothetical protein BWP39_03205 [Paraburkholderia acidicola]|uniref:Tlde1 domain-containing protein n=1 Tax=Paraburkholderia acidicola TaxID=1912599 RepID=A0A2A4F357_9BURK|nr:DUF2778 domain-containing protein [Paraburkholderia acidicola]PCE27525.1 hypothetical protein BWP39_03205 [Paraburkholderia acidicola]
MPVECTFMLNGQTTSTLQCPGVGSLAAYSGTGIGRDNPATVSKADTGPLPPGRYYIVDRQSGGHMGWLYDFARTYGYGTNRSQWFTLWREKTGDTTIIDGVKRGAFRLHPDGPRHLSEGCITVLHGSDFTRLAGYLRGQGATTAVPGTTMKAYGVVNVR